VNPVEEGEPGPLAHRPEPARPPRIAADGAWCRLEPLDPDRHAADLWAAFEATEARDWTFLAEGPFPDFASFKDWTAARAADGDALFQTVVVQGAARGVGSHLRIAPADFGIEIGHIHFAPALRRTPAATEALHLWIDQAFMLGYRRVEWKCDVLNEPSRAAARRLGFSFEGIFRNHRRFRGRNRDTAWYAIVEQDWPALRALHREWLDPAGFSPNGAQPFRLSERTAPLRRPDPVDR